MVSYPVFKLLRLLLATSARKAMCWTPEQFIEYSESLRDQYPLLAIELADTGRCAHPDSVRLARLACQMQLAWQQQGDVYPRASATPPTCSCGRAMLRLPRRYRPILQMWDERFRCRACGKVVDAVEVSLGQTPKQLFKLVWSLYQADLEEAHTAAIPKLDAKAMHQLMAEQEAAAALEHFQREERKRERLLAQQAAEKKREEEEEQALMQRVSVAKAEEAKAEEARSDKERRRGERVEWYHTLQREEPNATPARLQRLSQQVSFLYITEGFETAHLLVRVGTEDMNWSDQELAEAFPDFAWMWQPQKTAEVALPEPTPEVYEDAW